ncbi:MAG: 4-hydroxythreonine-4-phosphate dehydrogenase PdxA [Vicinamibacterales bacterium]
MKPRVAITEGDPAGIGPEIAARAAADPRVLAVCDPVIYPARTETPVKVGEISPQAGRAAFDAIVRAVEDARHHVVHGIATAPVNKAAFAAAGLGWKGHTDLLAHLCGVSDVAMMFHSPKLRVVLATVHVALRDVPRLITRDLILSTLRLTAGELPYFGVTRVPRIAVAGLNPHAGEGGLMGTEEMEVIAPAVRDAQREGLDVTGPLPADTVFLRAARKEFDCVLACYHDQGLMPVKLLSFGASVNVTLGLPIVRTSPDHGTAFDIAGQGVADPGSMIQAVLLAAELATRMEAAT